MKFPGALILLLAAGLAACSDSPRSPDGSNTAILGGYGGPRASGAVGAIPQPPAVAGATPQVADIGNGHGLAVWVQDQRVVAASYTPAGGWSAPRPLEEIYGEASDAQLAGNGRGAAMAIWRHTVGNIRSLRFSRFEGSTWSTPDVMPGALPRPRRDNAAAPQLHMDAEGRAFAEWPSGFNAQETQSARFVPGQGWSRALSEPVAAAATAPVTGAQ